MKQHIRSKKNKLEADIVNRIDRGYAASLSYSEALAEVVRTWPVAPMRYDESTDRYEYNQTRIERKVK